MNMNLSGLFALPARQFWAALTVAVTLCAAPQMAQAQTVNIDEISDHAALFIAVPASPNAYRKNAKLVAVTSEADFYQPAVLGRFMDSGAMLLRVSAESDTPDGWLEIYGTVWFDTKSDVETFRYKKDRLNHCADRAGKYSCIYHYDSDNNIPIEAGRVRKILPVNDQLVMTTSLGQLITATLEGDYDFPRSGLYLAKVPSSVSSELLTQDLTRVLMSEGMDSVVTGVNGNIGGTVFGSKILSINVLGRALSQ